MRQETALQSDSKEGKVVPLPEITTYAAVRSFLFISYQSSNLI